MAFEVLEHTADIGIRAWGADFKQALSQAALGMFSLITEPERVVERESVELELSAPSKEELVVRFLNELIYLFEVGGMLVKRCEVADLDEGRLKVRVYGEKLAFGRHPIRREIKAATYHMLKVEEDGGSRIEVLFDI